MKCEITPCPSPADVRLTLNHPDPTLQWSACLCMDHAKEAANTAAHGKGCVSLSPLDPPASKETDEV
jgi:hypothetical protein